ncbi:MAG: TIGR03435 family protein [Phycisphaerae bacterium]|nr:TIGR03435 family protein [Phycisphaerae bacterium]
MTMTISTKLMITTAALICGLLTTASYSQGKPAPASVGDEAPEIGLEKLLQAPKGAEASLKALKGKVVVLEFWGTWCGPCVMAIPHLNELVEKFKDKPVRFISITDEKQEVVEKFLEKRAIRGWVGLDTDRSIFNAYGFRGVPYTVLIDKEGKVAAVTHPNALTEDILGAVLAGKAPSISEMDHRRVGLPDAGANADLLPALFEVTIRPTVAENGGMSSSREKVTIECYSIQSIIAYAFDVRATRIVDRASLPDGRFDAIVSVPEARADMLKPLLQQALGLTFGFKAREETQELDAYVLTVAKGGRKSGLQPTASTGGSGSSSRDNRISAVNSTIDALGHMLESRLNRPVLDKTGLEGRFDWELKVESWADKAVDTALREQFGLELTSARVPVEVLIVEKASDASRGPRGSGDD